MREQVSNASLVNHSVVGACRRPCYQRHTASSVNLVPCCIICQPRAMLCFGPAGEMISLYVGRLSASAGLYECSQGRASLLARPAHGCPTCSNVSKHAGTNKAWHVETMGAAKDWHVKSVVVMHVKAIRELACEYLCAGCQARGPSALFLQ